MTSSNQIKALVRNKAQSLKMNSNIILRTVIFEFFLEKLSKSRFRNQFIIKGGFLITAMTNIDYRTTMDLDITLKSISILKDNLKTYLEEILNVQTLSQLDMRLIKVEDIQDGSDYPGLRATISVYYDGLREHLKIDFTTGDVLTPNDIDLQYKTILDAQIIELKSYNIETVLAEKIETILSRAILNTRMRDFYDVYILLKLKFDFIDFDLFKKALVNTMKNRNTYNQLINYKEIIDSLMIAANMNDSWVVYQQNYPFAKDIKWVDVMDAITTIMERIIT